MAERHVDDVRRHAGSANPLQIHSETLRRIIPVAIKKTAEPDVGYAGVCTTPSKSGSASMASQDSDRW